MSVQQPTPAQIADLASKIGYSDIAAAPEEYTAMIAGMVGVYDALEAIPNPDSCRRASRCTPSAPPPQRTRTMRGRSGPRSTEPTPASSRACASG